MIGSTLLASIPRQDTGETSKKEGRRVDMKALKDGIVVNDGNDQHGTNAETKCGVGVHERVGFSVDTELRPACAETSAGKTLVRVQRHAKIRSLQPRGGAADHLVAARQGATLGVGAGFALGAALCRPGEDVLLLWGDGSAGYGLVEVDTFVRHGLGVVAVVGNDAGWTQIAREQVEILNDDVGTVLRATDYHEAARGLGGEGLLLDEPDAAFSAEVPVRF